MVVTVVVVVKLRDLRRDERRVEGGGGGVGAVTAAGVVKRREDRQRGVGSRASGVAGIVMAFEEERSCRWCLWVCLDLFFGVSAMGALA